MKLFCIRSTLLAVLLVLSPALVSAGSLSVTIDYYHSDSTDLRDMLYGLKMMNDKQLQQIYDDLLIADDSSRRTLSALLDIADWYRNVHYRTIMTRRNMVFSEEFIVPERELTSARQELPGGELAVNLDVRKKVNRTVPLGLHVIYDDREIFSTPAKDLPLGRDILLTDVYPQFDAEDDVDLLFLKMESFKEEEEEVSD